MSSTSSWFIGILLPLSYLYFCSRFGGAVHLSGKGMVTGVVPGCSSRNLLTPGWNRKQRKDRKRRPQGLLPVTTSCN